MFRCLVPAVLALFTLVACSGACGRRDDEGPSTAAVLEPAPPPPKLNLSPGTAEALSIVVSRPQGETQVDVRPTLTFSRPMRALGEVEAQRAEDAAKPIATLVPAVPGQWRWLGSASVEFVPKERLPFATAFQVTVQKGTRALDGAVLPEDFRFSFSTPHPAVRLLSPEPGSTHARPETKVTLATNQPISKEALEAGVQLEVEGETAPRRLRVLSSKPPELPHAPSRRAPRAQETRHIELGLDRPLPLNRQVTLVVPPGLKGEEGPRVLDEEVRASFRTYAPLRFTAARMCSEHSNYCPRGPLLLFVNNPVRVESLQARLQVSPKVELAWDQVQAYPGVVRIPGDFQAGTSYAVRIEPGVLDAFGQPSQAEFREKVTTTDHFPDLQTGGDIALIEEGRGAALQPWIRNVSGLSVTGWRLSLPEAARLLASRQRSSWATPSRPADWTQQHSPGERNEQKRVSIDVGKLLGQPSGLAFFRYSAPPARGTPGTFAQVTDFAVHLKAGPGSGLVWVNRLSTGAPVPGSKVTVFSATGLPVWSGETDAEGLLRLPGIESLALPAAEYDWLPRFVLVAAEKDGRVGVTTNDWDRGLEAWAFNLDSGWEGKQPIERGLLFTDRGIYRPGDDVHLKGMGRILRVGKLERIPAGANVQLRIVDPRGEKVAEATVKTSGYGSFHAQLTLPKTGALGPYAVQALVPLRDGSVTLHHSFRVEEYRAPEFSVKVLPASDGALVSGEALRATATARYLFGAPMASTRVRWSVHRAPHEFRPEGLDDFHFSEHRGWDEIADERNPNPFVASGVAATDDKGLVTIHAGPAEAPSMRPWQYTLEAVAEDVNRQSSAGRNEWVVHPGDFYVGLRLSSFFSTVGQPASVHAVVTDTHGKRLKGKPIRLEVVRRTWRSVQQKDASGGFRTVSEPVDEAVHACAMTSDVPTTTCAFTPKAPGLYRAMATVSDEKGRSHRSLTSFYVSGGGWVAWERDDTQRIDLVPDKTRYDVGDVAKVLVKSPFAKAQALLTIEREGVLSQRRVHLEGTAVTLEIPITEEMVPNVFASVLLMRPREGAAAAKDEPENLGDPSFVMGLTKLTVERKSKRLTVEMKTPKSQYRPGEQVEVEVTVRDWKGQPRQAEVTLYVVDEAVLRLTGYQTPDPIENIYAPRPLSVRTGEPLLHLVSRRSYGEKGEEAGGGGGRGNALLARRDFRTTVLFLPQLETSADGRVRTSFKLPDNLTEFRIMAVAGTREDRFGAGETWVQVNKPLQALPALPRLARVGDRFEAGAVLHATDAAAGEVTVRAEVSGGLRLEGAAQKRVQLRGARPEEVRFSFLGESPSPATIRLTATGRSGHTDVVEVRVPLELPARLEAVALYGDTQDQTTEALELPDVQRDDVGGFELTLASSALATLQEGFEQLVDYPYGCLEQQASRLVPFVALRELSKTFGLPWPSGAGARDGRDNDETAWAEALLFGRSQERRGRNPDEVVAQAVRALAQLENGDGGFRYWPEGGCASPEGSAMATLALGGARDAGYAVPVELLQRAQSYLTRVASGSECGTCGGCSIETRVFAAWVLAREGRPQGSNHGPLWTSRAQLSLFSRALLTDTLFRAGDRALAGQLLQELLGHAKESAAGVHFEEESVSGRLPVWSSNTRTTGAVLQTLVNIAPDHPFVSKMARYLTGVRRKDGTWRNTQEAAFSLMGLTQLVKTKERLAPAFRAEVSLGGNPLVRQTFEGRALGVHGESWTLPGLRGHGASTRSQPLVFRKEGQGVLYYSARLRYLPDTRGAAKALESGLHVQRWFEPYAGGGQSSRFNAGDLVRVRLRVATSQVRHWAAIEVPLPAGLELVDASLSTTQQQSEGPEHPDEEGEEERSSPEEESAEGTWARRWWSPFNFTERRDAKMVLFSDSLPAGIHETSFLARATTPGTYVAPAAWGELMYEPEVFGRSESGSFEVVVAPETAGR